MGNPEKMANHGKKKANNNHGIDHYCYRLLVIQVIRTQIELVDQDASLIFKSNDLSSQLGGGEYELHDRIMHRAPLHLRAMTATTLYQTNQLTKSSRLKCWYSEK